MAEPISREHLLKRAKCCGCKCTHCPYIPKWVEGSTEIAMPISFAKPKIDNGYKVDS